MHHATALACFGLPEYITSVSKSFMDRPCGLHGLKYCIDAVKPKKGNSLFPSLICTFFFFFFNVSMFLLV